MSTTPVSMSPIFKLATAGLSSLVVLSALGGLYLVFKQQPPAWFLLLFEVPVLIAGGFGVMLSRGSRFAGATGPAITLLCIAGVVGVGSLLGWVGTGREAAGVKLTGALAFRAALAAAIAALAGAHVLSRRPKESLSLLIKGVLFGLPVLAVGALAYTGVLKRTLNSMSELVQIVGGALGAIIVGGLICASVHFLIRAFQVGVEEPTTGK